MQTNENNRNALSKRFGLWLFLLPVAMLGLSFAAVPFYRMFCQVTGYNGTTQRAAAAPTRVLDRTVTVRFDANISPALDWDFQPEQREIRLKIGENKLAFFRAINRSDKPLTGTATFNVTPEAVGGYFNKIQCFCFTRQTLAPGETAEMPVSFFIDPAIMDDPDARDFTEITLSYTFFKAKDKKTAVKGEEDNHG
ncbi:MAG: cytochrome c oxidase assembly protein [Alphaproteobacteria bacterium]|jgi:cytochrome c oxidase assembly protein subunit 11